MTQKTTYDDTPYESYPFYYTSPGHLGAVGRLFGIDLPKLQKVRVLDLGCASGGNIINFALNNPESYTLGIDLSKVQVDAGNKQIKALDLKNIELKAISIMDFDESFGKFDYIICHGVYSWVPAEVRDKILEICSKNLSDEGIAFVSYNTLPGWNSMASFKEMMQFHSSMFEDTKDKVQQTRLFMDFITESLEGSNTPYERFLKQEVQLMKHYNDSYILHEFLEGINSPCYFRDFVKHAQVNGLAYLGDTNVSTMYAGNLPGKASEKLSDINDIVRSEQYMDFINNRRFRCTLLCNSSVKINRNITPRALDELYIGMNIVVEQNLDNIDINNESLTFYLNNNREQSITTTSPLMKAVFCVFIENKGLLSSIDTIVKIAATKISGVNLDALKAEIDNNILNLIFKGFVKVLAAPIKAVNIVSDKPKVNNLVLNQVLNPNAYWITNQANDIIQINIFERFAIKYMDGNHTKEQIIDELMRQHVAKGELNLNQDGQIISDEKAIRSALDNYLNDSLEKFRINYLLVA